MLSNRPYLLRAFYQWIVDSNCTPILVIDAEHPRAKVPQDFVEDGEIIFNISSDAIRDLEINNKQIEFKASFSGVIHMVAAPIKAILAMYAEENGEGIFFDGEEDEEGDAMVQLKGIEGTGKNILKDDFKAQQSSEKPKPFLKLVE